jgi:cysteine desulfurase/selenocysteine lyase
MYMLSEQATMAFEEARKKVAKFIGAASPEEIVWTKNASESLNLVAHAWGRRHLKAGDEIVLTPLEHHSNLVPWHLLARACGVCLKFMKLHEDGTLDLESLPPLLASGKVKLVGFTHASNALGTVTPVSQIAELAHEAGAKVLVDGCQSAPHLPVDVVALNVDFYAASGHKMLGPTGIGFLYGRRELLADMDPFLGGGEMIEEVTLESSTYKEPPYRFEAGTPPITEAVALGAAVDYLSALGMENVRRHEKQVLARGLERLSCIPGLRIFGPKDPDLRSGVISFDLDGIHPHDIAQFLDADGIAIRAGHHCAQPIMAWLGVPATARASVHVYSKAEEMDVLADSLLRIRSKFT